MLHNSLCPGLPPRNRLSCVGPSRKRAETVVRSYMRTAVFVGCFVRRYTVQYSHSTHALALSVGSGRVLQSLLLQVSSRVISSRYFHVISCYFRTQSSHVVRPRRSFRIVPKLQVRLRERLEELWRERWPLRLPGYRQFHGHREACSGEARRANVQLRVALQDEIRVMRLRSAWQMPWNAGGRWRSATRKHREDFVELAAVDFKRAHHLHSSSPAAYFRSRGPEAFKAMR